MLKISVKGRMLLTLKDFIFIITWLFFLLIIADAFAGQPRIASYFIWVWYILGVLYALKVADNFRMQKIDRADKPILENGSKSIKATKPRFFEA